MDLKKMWKPILIGVTAIAAVVAAVLVVKARGEGLDLEDVAEVTE